MTEPLKRPSMTKKELTERLAAALGQLFEIPYDHRKGMTAEQVISLCQCDHGIHHAIGGPHTHWNYTWRQILEHREKTHKIDRPQIRKTQRLTEAHLEFQRRLGRKTDPADAAEKNATPPSRFGGRAMPGSKKSGLKRTMGGRVVKRA
jgi:hypothetical protein